MNSQIESLNAVAFAATRRRWTRFGLRTLLIAVTVIALLLGVGMAWYHAQEAEFIRERGIAERLVAAGADVQWEQHAPKWLSWLSEAAAFKRVEVVTGGDLDRVLDELLFLPYVREVVTSSNQLKRDALDRLAKFEQVTTVTIGYGQQIASPYNTEQDISPDEIDARLSQK